MSVLHTERKGASSCMALSRLGTVALFLGLLFLPPVSPSLLLGGVELAWGELCTFLFLVSSGCKPEHLALGFMHEQCLLHAIRAWDLWPLQVHCSESV